ncbi:YlbF family regulator [Numidum massiliense]|uniref:YlbF family regulator n=1 Tax=Numidum massiliense TaxID=1522315 RepID=UPI0006D52F2D|nr:YlbF family regulator [Numidum massiliense]
MGNVYDKAHALARELRQAPEVVQLREISQQIETNPEQKKLLLAFQQQQFALQAKQMQGESPSEEDVNKLNEQVAKLQQEPLLVQYLELMQRLSVITADIQQIMSEPLQDIFHFAEGDMPE